MSQEREFFTSREKIYPWVYATGILLGELLVIENARVGMMVHLLVLGGLLVQASFCSASAAGRIGRAATPETDIAFEVAVGADDVRSGDSATVATEKTEAFGGPGKSSENLATATKKATEGAANEFATALNGSRFYLALTLAPLIRILSLSLPLAVFPLMYWYAVVSLPLLVGAVAVAVLNRYGHKEMGLTIGWRLSRSPFPGRSQIMGSGQEQDLYLSLGQGQNKDLSPGWIGSGLLVQLLIGMVGLPLGLAEYFVLHPQPLAPTPDPAVIWLPALILLICTGFTEEFIFRGIMQKAAIDFLGWRTALVLVSFIFSVLHITHLSVLDVFFVFGVAAFFAKIVYRTGSLFGVTLAHGLTNITIYLFWPFVF